MFGPSAPVAQAGIQADEAGTYNLSRLPFYQQLHDPVGSTEPLFGIRMWCARCSCPLPNRLRIPNASEDCHQPLAKYMLERARDGGDPEACGSPVDLLLQCHTDGYLRGRGRTGCYAPFWAIEGTATNNTTTGRDCLAYRWRSNFDAHLTQYGVPAQEARSGLGWRPRVLVSDTRGSQFPLARRRSVPANQRRFAQQNVSTRCRAGSERLAATVPPTEAADFARHRG